MKKSNCFALVSSFNNNVDWVHKIFPNHLVISKGELSNIPEIHEKKSKNIGSNIYSYLNFIYENYDSLNHKIFLIKGNIFPRHVDKDYFIELVDRVSNQYFSGIEQKSKHNPKFPIAFFGSDDGYNEINNSWYSNQYPSRYFNTYDSLAQYFLMDYVKSPYLRFSPGANFFITDNCIKRYPRILYLNLSKLVMHDANPVEAHILERFLYNMWSSDFKFKYQFLNDPLDTNSIPEIKNKIKFNPRYLAIRLLSNVFE